MRGPPRSVCDNWDATDIKFNIAKGPELKLKKLSRDVHQHELVKKYPAGELGPHHEDYPTVLMFLANRTTGIGCLYEEVVGEQKCRAQPQEINAESNGQATADTVFASMQPRRQ